MTIKTQIFPLFLIIGYYNLILKLTAQLLNSVTQIIMLYVCKMRILFVGVTPFQTSKKKFICKLNFLCPFILLNYD